MPSLFTKLTSLARSPQGKKALAEAQRLAKDPATRRKVDDVRRRFMSKGQGPKPS